MVDVHHISVTSGEGSHVYLHCRACPTWEHDFGFQVEPTVAAINRVWNFHLRGESTDDL